MRSVRDMVRSVRDMVRHGWIEGERARCLAWLRQCPITFNAHGHLRGIMADEVRELVERIESGQWPEGKGDESV